MTLFVVITYKRAFSQSIIAYFKYLNSLNNHKLLFCPIGVDEREEWMVIDEINEEIKNVNNLKCVTIFADAGIPSKILKKIKINNDQIKLIKSSGSLIENGFLTYMMLNTSAPIETVLKTIEEKIEK